MKFTFISLFLYFSLSGSCQDSIAYSVTNISGSVFVQAEKYRDGIAALSHEGKIYSINPRTLKVTLLNDSCRLIASDKLGRVWMVDSSYYIHYLTDTVWQFYRSPIKGRINSIVFKENNDPVFITHWGVYDSELKMYYGTDDIIAPPGLWEIPSPRHVCLFNDLELWMVFNAFRFENGLIFNLKDKRYTRFKSRNVYPYSIRDILSTNKGLLLLKSSMGISEIEYFLQDSAYRIYINKFADYEKGPDPEEEETIGAAFYENSNSALYYYSSKGLLKARINEEVKSLSNIVTIMPPVNSWYNGFADKQEFARDVKDVFSIDGSFIIYNREYGLFIFADGKLTNLR
jgi:hypothetical protein